MSGRYLGLPRLGLRLGLRGRGGCSYVGHDEWLAWVTMADEGVACGSVYNWCVKNVSVKRQYLYPQRGR